MGSYINPPDQTKELWLNTNGEVIDRPSTFVNGSNDVFVCLVDNGLFTAAGIIIDDRELEAFSDPSDNRAKTWYRVPREKILEVAPAVERILQ